MSQPDIALVRQTINTHLTSELNGVISKDRICFENRSFTAPPLYDSVTKIPNLWLRETLFVIAEDNPALQLHEAVGRTLYEVFYPVGSGTEQPEALRKRIVDAFEKKYGLTHNTSGTVVGLTRIVRHDARRADELWFTLSVSIHWRTYSVATFNRTT